MQPTTPFPSGGSTTATGPKPRNPVGVPYYITDPDTGLPAEFDPSGRQIIPDPNDSTKKVYADTGDAVGADVKVEKRRWTASVATQVPTQLGRYGHETVNLPGQQNVAPRYFEGDEWTLANAGHDTIMQVQAAMQKAGMLKTGEFSPGFWDKKTKDAFKDLLSYANATGSTWQDSLPLIMNATPPTPKQPLTVKVTNPDDLRAVFHKAALDTLGVGMPKDQLDQMVNAYQGLETQAQTQAYNQADTGGTLTASPSADVYAADQARAQDPNLAQEHDALGFFNQFQNLVGSWQKV
jgi:hypothetical protein